MPHNMVKKPDGSQVCTLCGAVWGDRNAPSVVLQLVEWEWRRYALPRHSGIERFPALPMVQWLDLRALLDLKPVAEVLEAYPVIWWAAFVVFWLAFVLRYTYTPEIGPRLL